MEILLSLALLVISQTFNHVFFGGMDQTSFKIVAYLAAYKETLGDCGNIGGASKLAGAAEIDQDSGFHSASPAKADYMMGGK